MIVVMKRFLKVSSIIVLSIIGLLLLLWFLLNWYLRPRTTEFEDCFPPVTLVSTESGPIVQMYKITERNTSFAKTRFEDYDGDYRMCISRNTPCSATWPASYKFSDLLVGTEIILDGFAIRHKAPLSSNSTYFRGTIDSRIVWLLYRDAGLFTDFLNENNYKVMGMKDELGNEISQIGWKCTL